MINANVLKPTILVADDHQEILDFIADDLSDHYHVLKALDGEQALHCIDMHAVDLIVSDIMMPKVNGYEFCTRLKENIHFSHIPFIMLTAKNSLQSKIEGLEYGADAYIEKPFSPTFLQAQIASLLRNRQHVRAHYNHSPSSPMQSTALNKSDRIFLEKLNVLIVDNMAEQTLCVDLLADQMNMSRPTLYRKIKALSDLSPNELINMTRLRKAAEFLNDGNYKVYEISSMVGFSSSSHFIRNFQKQFGISPKEWSEQRKQHS
ncbi:response regulator transcription factor [Sphingobacterium paludis]|jgi:two-component system, cell cycle response regulator|uniref:Helix-turn-helix protein n=1 Tax=Sphingobacterium paludis TaxID=1476465 RepID=A0A4R7CX34_9SPHI|nr:response regulator [Sphingobacterium paludis]TDS10248.1 helix-turn-helix protein [Sphingobacterium paludis]